MGQVDDGGAAWTVTDAEASAHILRWLADVEHGTWSWPTDGCGYEQHMRFVRHRNDNWNGGGPEEWAAFVRAYAENLSTARRTPGAAQEAK